MYRTSRPCFRLLNRVLRLLIFVGRLLISVRRLLKRRFALLIPASSERGALVPEEIGAERGWPMRRQRD